MPQIASNITRLREAKRLSKGEVARRLGYKSVATVSHWETGRRVPTPDNVERLSEVLGATTAEIDPENEAFDREKMPPKGVMSGRLQKPSTPADVESVAPTQQAGEDLMDRGIPIPDQDLFGQLLGVWRLLGGEEERRDFVTHAKEYIGLPVGRRHARKKATR